MVFPNESGEGFTIDIIKQEKNVIYLFNAWYWYYHYQFNNPFSVSNDFSGRLSWNQSGRLNGMLRLYQRTGDEELGKEMEECVERLLAVQNKQLGLRNGCNPDFLWASKIYSLDREAVSLLVNNSMILNSLLEIANAGLLHEKVYDEVIDTAKKSFEYYEQYYREGHYYIQYDCPFYLDGVVVPWNWQNAMGLVSLELYRATGEVKYKERCEELIHSFQSEWSENEKTILWHYWPDEFYRGWTSKEVRSVHTPEKTETKDTLMEDISHSGINVKFLLKYYELIPNGLVEERQIKKIQNTMELFCFRDGFSGYISGDTEYEPKSYLYMVSPYWSDLYNANYYEFLKYFPPAVFPEFDMQVILYAYANMYHPAEASLTVHRRIYDVDGNFIKEKEIILETGEIKDFVKKNYKR